MTDPFTDVADELMTRSTDMASDFPAGAGATGAKTKKHVCPYCGAVTAVAEKPTGPCPRCSMDDTPATRAATKARIGPWYVLQSRNPSAPGMKWATLLSLVSKGQVTPRSILRGPTTHQLWKFAAHVKGLSREFNLCYSCGGEIEKSANQCMHCDRLQEPPVNPDTLLETRDVAAASGPRMPIQREIRSAPPAMTAPTDVVLAGPPSMEETRRPRNPDDGILSAKELAAAFQLDFNPPVQQTMPTASSSSSSLDVPQKRRAFKTLVVLILLAAIGGGAVLYVKPEYRAKSIAWLNHAFTSSKHYLASNKPSDANSPANKSAPPFLAPVKSDGSTPAVPAATSGSPETPTTPASQTDVSANTAPPTSTPPPAAPVAVPAPVVTSVPTPTAPVVATPTPDRSQVDQGPVTPAPVVAAPPAVSTPAPPAPAAIQTPAPTAQGPAPDQVQTQEAAAKQRREQQQEQLKAALNIPDPKSLSLEAQRDIENTLYLGARAAEGLPDYDLAVKCYTKIEMLDPSVRHSDVHTNLVYDQSQLPK